MTNESIYQIAQQDEQNEQVAYYKMNHEVEKKQLYRSVYADKVRQEDQAYKDQYNGHKTQGLNVGEYKPSVDQWMKKNQNHPDLPEPQEYHYKDQLGRKQPVPNQYTDQPVCGIKSNVDFVKQNIKKAQLMVPKVRTDKEIDWTQKPDFGKVPEYLPKVKTQILTEQAQLQEYEKFQKNGQKAFKLDESEQQQMLSSLKSNWEDLHNEYVGGTKAVLDTFGQRNRKMWLEKRMAEIEADICLLEQGNIFVK